MQGMRPAAVRGTHNRTERTGRTPHRTPPSLDVPAHHGTGLAIGSHVDGSTLQTAEAGSRPNQWRHGGAARSGRLHWGQAVVERARPARLGMAARMPRRHPGRLTHAPGIIAPSAAAAGPRVLPAWEGTSTPKGGRTNLRVEDPTPGGPVEPS